MRDHLTNKQRRILRRAEQAKLPPSKAVLARKRRERREYLRPRDDLGHEIGDMLRDLLLALGRMHPGLDRRDVLKRLSRRVVAHLDALPPRGSLVVQRLRKAAPWVSTVDEPPPGRLMISR
jgi:hypothetical protein